MKIYYTIGILVLLIFTGISCKNDKKAPVEESLIINGENAPLKDSDFFDRPTQADEGNYITVLQNMEVEIKYEGLFPEGIIWKVDDVIAETGTTENLIYTWTNPGISEVKALLENGDERVTYVFVKEETKGSPDSFVETDQDVQLVEQEINDGDRFEEDKESARVDRVKPNSPSRDKSENTPKKEKTVTGTKSIETSPEAVTREKKDEKSEPQKEKVTKPAKPAVVNKRAEEEVELDRTGRAGLKNSKCPGVSVVQTPTYIKITPKKLIEIAYFKVFATETTKAVITLTSDGGEKPVQMRRQLNAGTISEINFQDLGYLMKPGYTYTITVAPGDSSFGAEDLSCQSGSGSNNDVTIEYGGAGKIIFDISYKY